MSDRLRILYVIGTLDLGGAEGQLVELATGLDRSRFEVVVCCLASAGPHRAPLEAAGIPVHVVGLHGLVIPRDLLRAVPHLVRFFRFMRSWRPDIVHGVLFWAYVLGALAASAARVPVVLASRRSLSHFKKGSPYRYYLFLERLANWLTDLVIANSEAVRGDAIATEGLAPRKVVVIPNGLDIERYTILPDPGLRTSLGLHDGVPVVGVIANFLAYKGHHVFLDAWNRVVEQVPDAVALMIGDGRVRPEVQTHAEALGISDSLRFLGVRRDLPALLALMDVVVHPSFEEGFSNVILEAMAAGKPVVATAVGGNPEAVAHGETGLLVSVGDADALAIATMSILQNASLGASFGRAGRQRVAERFTVRRMIDEYEALYEARAREARLGISRSWADVRNRRAV